MADQTKHELASLEIFLAKVKKVYMKSEDFLDLKKDTDFVAVYNSNIKS